jgi:mRNA-degrading endonuclease RelE of RelBE toxin-antitoxin system
LKIILDNTTNLLYCIVTNKRGQYTYEPDIYGILRDLQNMLLNDPKSGDVIQGTGGLRKIRIPMGNKGKSGGSRVIYVDIELKEVIYFINVYSKSEKDDLTEDEKKAFKAVVKILKEE